MNSTNNFAMGLRLLCDDARGSGTYNWYCREAMGTAKMISVGNGGWNCLRIHVSGRSRPPQVRGAEGVHRRHRPFLASWTSIRTLSPMLCLISFGLIESEMNSELIATAHRGGTRRAWRRPQDAGFIDFGMLFGPTSSSLGRLQLEGVN